MSDHTKSLLNFNEYFKRTQEVFNTPGCSICVTKGDKTIMSSGFGYKDKERTKPVDADTQFYIASNTKGFVALCAAILADENKLKWDSPVIEYIPWFKMYDDYATNHVTLRDIFSHQTGLPENIQVRIDTDTGKSVQEMRKEIVEKIRYIKPSYEIHTDLQYNSLMYTVAAYIIGELSGMLWEEFTIERVLKPLDMNNTFFNQDKARATGNCSDFYFCKDDDDSIEAFKFDEDDAEKLNPYGAAGCMTSTANDMQNYLIMLSNSGKFKDKQIVSNENLKQMFKSAMVQNWDYPFPELGNAGAASGWFTWDYRGYKVIEHGGFFGTQIYIMQDEKIGISVFTNLCGCDYCNVLPIIHTIYDRLLELKPIDWISGFKKMLDGIIENRRKDEEDNMIKKIEGTKISHPLDDYCGKYANEISTPVIVSQKDGNLFIKFSNDENIQIEHYHYDTFKVRFEKYDYEMFLRFQSDIKGNINKIVLENEESILTKVDL